MEIFKIRCGAQAGQESQTPSKLGFTLRCQPPGKLGAGRPELSPSRGAQI